MNYIQRRFGFDGPAYGYVVRYYDGGEKWFKQGAAACKHAEKCARDGRFCSLNVLTCDENGNACEHELAAC